MSTSKRGRATTKSTKPQSSSAGDEKPDFTLPEIVMLRRLALTYKSVANANVAGETLSESDHAYWVDCLATIESLYKKANVLYVLKHREITREHAKAADPTNPR